MKNKRYLVFLVFCYTINSTIAKTTIQAYSSSINTMNLNPSCDFGVTLTAQGNGIFCEGSDIILTATAGFDNYSFELTGTGIVQVGTSNTFTTTQTGQYTVTVTDANDCSETSNIVTIYIDPLPTPIIQGVPTTSLCEGECTQLFVEGFYQQISWYEGDPNDLANATLLGNNNPIDICEAGNYFVYVIDERCSATSDINVTVSEACCPSSVGDFSSVEYRCASEPASPPSNIPSLAEVIATLDVDAIDKTFTWSTDVTTPVSYSGNNCNPKMYEYELIVGCTNDPNLALSAGIIQVVIYPEMEASTYIVYNDGTCGASLGYNCSNYSVTNSIDANGSVPDYSGLNQGTVTFTISNPDAIALGIDPACVTTTREADYACCPSSVGDFSSQAVYCASEAPIYPTIPSNFDIISSLDNYSDVSIEWSNDPSVPISYTGNNCDPQIFSYALTVICDSDPSIQLEGGTIEVTLFPTIDAVGHEVIGDGTCSPYLEVACSDYEVVNDLDTNGAMPDLSSVGGEGMIQFTVMNPLAQSLGITGSCIEAIYEASYVCCDAQAGFVQLNSALCPGDPIIATSNDSFGNPTHQTANDYTTSYLLVDATGTIITIQYATTTNTTSFDALAGNYTVCVYNEYAINPPIPSPSSSTDLSLSAIGTIDEGCYDYHCSTIEVPEQLVVTCNHTSYQGGLPPFGHYTDEICIEGGTLPYTYEWSQEGYVRPTILSTGMMRVDYGDDAIWSLTITDANGCTDDIDGNLLVFGNAPTDEELQITSADIQTANYLSLCRNGSIEVEVMGGDGNYEYTWSGPSTWQNSGGIAHITSLPKGWYGFTVTDGLGASVSDWYYVGCTRLGRGKQSIASLVRAYPNPFEQEVFIEYTLETSSKVELVIFDVMGRQVTTLVDQCLQEAGVYRQVWQPHSDLPSGIYFYRLQVGEEVTVGRMISE